MQTIIRDMEGIELRLRAVVPQGYMLALNIRALTPEFFKSTYPDAWVRIYTERRYALFDPVILWSRFHDGSIRWSEIGAGFLQGAGKQIMENAAKFGLVYGGGVSTSGRYDAATKSLLFGARQDRELTNDELAELAAILDMMMGAIGEHAGLSDVELGALRDLAQGMTHTEIADARGISPATVKKRIERARLVLGAKSSMHAVAIATKRGLIVPDENG